MDEPTRQRLARYLVERTPSIDPKRMTWLDDTVIIRTGHKDADDLRKSLQGARFGSVTLATERISGSISKLKKLADQREKE